MSKSPSKSSSSGIFIFVLLALAALLIVGVNNLKHGFFNLRESGPQFVTDIVDKFHNPSAPSAAAPANADTKSAAKIKKSKSTVNEKQKDDLAHRDRAELDDLLNKVAP